MIGAAFFFVINSEGAGIAESTAGLLPSLASAGVIALARAVMLEVASSRPGCRLSAMSNYRFPDGVRFLGESSGRARMTVNMPTDEEGYFGRECPSCERQFRIAAEDYEALPDELVLWCVYCGHRCNDSNFTTTQQMARLERVATDFAEQRVSEMLGETFRGLKRRSRGSLVQLDYRPTSFHPKPLPGINEERLVRERACSDCELRYAVFGEHRFCPICGPLPPLTTALDSLSAEATRLDAWSEVPAETHARLRESGVLDRTYVDTIENAVGVVETLAKRVFEERVSGAERILRRRGQVFQRLNELADLFAEHLGVDVRGSLGTAWVELQESWAVRHIFVHCDGIVDAKYLFDVPDSPLRLGQRLTVSERMARKVLRDAERLCRSLDPGCSQ